MDVNHPASPSFRRLAGILLALWGVMYLPLLIGHRVLPWDAMDEFYPTVYFNAYNLHHGLAPWWNPYIYAGHPQIADPQGMLFSPLLMAWMLIPSSPSASWFAWAVLLHMLMGGIAMLAFLRQLGSNALGSLLGSIVFMAGGVAASRMEHVPIELAYAYAPVVLWAMRHFLAKPTWSRGIPLGLAAGALVTHLVQLAYLLVPLLLVYGIAGTVGRWPHYDKPERRRWLAGILVAGVIGIMLGLPQIVFTQAFLALSNRVELPLAASRDASLSITDAVTLLYPNALHALAGLPDGVAPRTQAYFYVGVLPLLFLAGLPGAWRLPSQRRQLAFFGTLVGCSAIYMLGLHTPAYGWLYEILPGMKHFRRPSDAAFLFNLSLAVLTGLSASHIRLDTPQAARRWLVAAAIWLLVASLGMRDVQGNWQMRSVFAMIVAAAAWWQLGRSSASTRQIMVWLLVVMVVDYRCFNLNGRFTEQGDGARVFLRDPVASYLKAQTKKNEGLPPRIEPMGAGMRWDNMVVLRGLHSTQGYNPLRYALYDHWYGAHDVGIVARTNTPYNPGPDSAMANLLGVAYVVRDITASYQPWTTPTGYQLAYRHGTIEVWRNDRVYPRVLTPLNMRYAEGDPDPATFASTDFTRDFWLTPRDADDHRLAELSAAQCGHAVRVVDTTSAPTYITIRTSAADGPGWLVVSQLDFPGWRAQANGIDLPIHRANGMFSAICVPSGEQSVSLSFNPLVMVAAARNTR